MPAPNTSTDVMPVVEPSIGTPLQRGEVGLRQPVPAAGGDHDRRGVVAARECGEALLGERGLRVVRQVHGGVGALGGCGRENEDGPGDHEAEQEDDDGPSSPDESGEGECSMIESFHARRIGWVT